MDRIINFLKLPSDRRSKDEINAIAPFFQSNKFFANLLLESGENSLNKALRQMTHSFIPAGQTICKIGDEGKEYYIILQGSAKVYVPVTHEVDLSNLELIDYIKDNKDKILWDKKTLPLKTKIKQYSLVKSLLRKSTAFQQQNNFQLERKKYEFKIITFIGKMKEGKAFGELALQAKTQKRATR